MGHDSHGELILEKGLVVLTDRVTRVKDQTIWVDERLPRASSTDYGNSLHAVQKLAKRNQNFAIEIAAAEPRVSALKHQVFNYTV